MADDPFPGIYERVETWGGDVIEATADAIAGWAASLWHKPGKVTPGEPTREQVAGAVACALSLLAQRPGGVTFAGRHWCHNRHVGCPGHDADTPSGFDGSLGVGSVYTPDWLAAEVTEKTLEPLVYAPGPRETGDPEAWRLRRSDELLALRVADIAVGSGAFLVAACRYLADRVAEAWQREGRDGDRWLEARRLVAAHCLYGVDVNPLALELTKLSVALVSRATDAELGAKWPDHFAAADALLGRLFVEMFPHVFIDRGGFDAVIGNPPWLGGQKINSAFGKGYRDRLVNEIAHGKRGSADLSAYFLLRGWDLLNPKGQLGMITTNTISQGDTREIGLDQIADAGGVIWWAVKSEPWPTASASAQFSAVSISKAPVARQAPRYLVA